MGDLIKKREQLDFYPPREKGKTASRPYLPGLATRTARILVALGWEPTRARWEMERELEILTLIRRKW